MNEQQLIATKFLEWCATNGLWRNGGKGNLWYSITKRLPGIPEEDMTSNQLFEYWYNNIYKLDKI